MSNADDAAVSVKSDGTQHVRAWKDGDCIRLLVADYSNAGRENFLYSHAEKGYRPLSKGDNVKGTIKLTVSDKVD